MIIGCSYDSSEQNKVFAETEGFPYVLLSDIDRSVAKEYGVAFEPGHQYENWPKRYSFLIDPEGSIRKIYKVRDVAGHAEQLLYDLREAVAESRKG